MIEQESTYYFAIYHEMWNVRDEFQGRKMMYYFYN